MEDLLLKNPTVGEILRLDFLEELGINEQRLADQIGVSSLVIEDIIQGRSILTADMDLRLCRYFSLSDGYFLRLQNAYDLLEAKRQLGEILNEIVPYASIAP